MIIACIWEHNAEDTLLYARDFPGAFSRGTSLEEALGKMPVEIASYMDWLGQEAEATLTPVVVQEKASDLMIRDADSDVLFDSERAPLTAQEYQALKELTLRSARDFHALYLSIADKNSSCLAPRKTFYDAIPRTAEQMYRHTRDVNSYYFGEIGVDADREGPIDECRARGFALLEAQPDFLKNRVLEGSYGEEWSLRKVCRRFVWHDRIHAKAMWRMAKKTFGPQGAENIFRFKR